MAGGRSVPNEELREYEILEGPFSGTYGHVRIGRHKTGGWIRAIKQLHQHVLPEVIIQEAVKQQAIKSPYVVQIFELWDEPKAIVMEYCKIGLDRYLKERLTQTKGQLPYDEARDVLHGILQGLNDAHKAGVVHGDIKPANVRFGTAEKDRELGLPKLADFGAARKVSEAAQVLKGSTNWMAPEVLNGGPPTEASDYFSFGVLAYLVFTGHHPYFANDPSCLTSEDDNIANPVFRPIPLSVHRPDIPVQVADLVMALLSGDVEARRRGEVALKAALSQRLEPEEKPVPVSQIGQRHLTEEETAQLQVTYETARELFFREFLPLEAVKVLDTFLRDFRWERFEGQGITRIADCWSLRGFISNSMGLFDAAVDAASKGLRTDGDHANSLHVRGYAYVQLGRYVEAEADLSRALDLTRDVRKRGQITKLLETLRVRRGV